MTTTPPPIQPPLPPGPDVTPVGLPSMPPPPVPVVTKKRSLTWLWILLGVLGVLGTVAVIVFVMVVNKIAEGYSAEYNGAPVEASDASAAVAVSDDALVSYHLGSGWVDANDFVDLSAAFGELPPGAVLVGAHLTDDPTVTVPEFIIVLSGAPDFPGQPLTFLYDGYVLGATGVAAELDASDKSTFTTANGLEGVSGSYVATIAGMEVNTELAVLGHGETVVFVQWVSYEGTVDQDSFRDFVGSIRIDG